MIKQPYLVQRGTICWPLAKATTRLSKAVDLDYMGSAEFEFGALPKSFRSMENRPRLLRLFPSILLGDSALRVFSSLSDEDFALYGHYLLRLRVGDIRLKERSEFDDRSSTPRTNFWWDIENHVMWGFHKKFMNRVPDYVNSSLAYMNAPYGLLTKKA